MDLSVQRNSTHPQSKFTLVCLFCARYRLDIVFTLGIRCLCPLDFYLCLWKISFRSQEIQTALENPQSSCKVLQGHGPRARLFHCGSEMETGSGAEQSCSVLPPVAVKAPSTQSRADQTSPLLPTDCPARNSGMQRGRKRPAAWFKGGFGGEEGKKPNQNKKQTTNPKWL